MGLGLWMTSREPHTNSVLCRMPEHGGVTRSLPPSGGVCTRTVTTQGEGVLWEDRDRHPPIDVDGQGRLLGGGGSEPASTEQLSRKELAGQRVPGVGLGHPQTLAGRDVCRCRERGGGDLQQLGGSAPRPQCQHRQPEAILQAEQGPDSNLKENGCLGQQVSSGHRAGTPSGDLTSRHFLTTESTLGAPGHQVIAAGASLLCPHVAKTGGSSRRAQILTWGPRSHGLGTHRLLKALPPQATMGGRASAYELGRTQLGS